MSSFEVTCCYCGYMFSLVEDDNYTDDLFQESEKIGRTCPECNKKILIEVSATWSYRSDKFDSDELNEDFITQ